MFLRLSSFAIRTGLRARSLKPTQCRFMTSWRFSTSHEYIAYEEDGSATIGITDHAQSELGDVVYVDLPEEGTELDAGEVFGSVESTKAASSLYAPVDLEVTSINEALADECSLVNEAAETDGWMLKAKLTDMSQLDAMMDKDAYEAHCKEDA